MPHHRRTILDLVKDRLDSLPTTAARVFEDVTTPIQNDALPALVIEPASPERIDSSGSLSGVGGKPLRKQKRTLRIAITGVATTRATADQIALEVEKEMEGTPFLPEEALGPVLISTEFASGLGQRKVFGVQLMYEAYYFTAADDPSVVP